MTPLITGADADRARAVVATIADALRDPETATDPALAGADVGRGAAGVALLFAELHAEHGEQRDADAALAWLDRALDKAADDTPSALLYPGTVGVGWTLAHLEGSLVDPDPGDNDVDDLVARALAVEAWPSPDLIRGVTGCGVYVLERGRPGDAVVDRLKAMATETDDGVTWWVDPQICLPERRAQYPDGYYDVGVAHGQAGILVLLAHFAAQGTPGAKDLLDGATRWLLAQRLPEDRGPGRYPALIDAKGLPPNGSRLAWCYGDPGVAVALVNAGRALNDDEIVREGRDLALDAAARTFDGDPRNGVVDAPLCHGSAGLLHVFRRLHEATGDERLRDAARFWYDDTLARQHPDGYGSMRLEDGAYRYEPSAGFLEGAAGVGLALLSATSDRDPAWDALLLTKPVP